MGFEEAGTVRTEEYWKSTHPRTSITGAGSGVGTGLRLFVPSMVISK